MAIEVGGNGRGFEEIDRLLKSANYTKVYNMIRNQDNIYVHNTVRSSYFGDDQKPRLMSKSWHFCDKCVDSLLKCVEMFCLEYPQWNINIWYFETKPI